jgi:hypothetical protein
MGHARMSLGVREESVCTEHVGHHHEIARKAGKVRRLVHEEEVFVDKPVSGNIRARVCKVQGSLEVARRRS